jgi:ketosteroid isomerase-like protein
VSAENVEAVRAWVAAINARDVARLTQLADPGIEYEPLLAELSGRDGAVYRGHADLRAYVAELGDAWEWFHVEVEEYVDLGDQVINVGRLHAKGRSSGVEVVEDVAWLHTFRPGTGPGRYLRHQAFPTVAAAMDAAG